MIVWVDAQLPPQVAQWLAERFNIEAKALRELGLRDASDKDIFAAARAAQAVILTKDRDFVDMAIILGTPPKVIWLTCGNCTNRHLRDVVLTQFDKALALLESGEDIVEIEDVRDRYRPSEHP